MSRHLPEDTETVRYYVCPHSNDNTTTWYSTGLSNEDINTIINDYTNGLKSWNNVYFYKQNSSGSYEKKKVINVIEGTISNHDIIIYPYVGSERFSADVAPIVETICNNDNDNRHYMKFKMKVHLNYIQNGSISRTGAHELGHVLGLGDLDYIEQEVGYVWHHEEVIMGYKAPRQLYITYRDLAGVAITRGFHTDSDHKWLYDSVNSSSGNYKLICSIYNGVKRVPNLSDYTYLSYKSCNNNHELSSNNMMAVGCYGNKDYYKCKYCKYVAPFSSNKEQNYQYVDCGSNNTHKVNNQVTGLLYNFYEEHSHTVSHERINLSSHKSYCICSDAKQMGHAVSSDDFNSGAQIVRCLICGGNASIGIIQNGIVVKVSETEVSY